MGFFDNFKRKKKPEKPDAPGVNRRRFLRTLGLVSMATPLVHYAADKAAKVDIARKGSEMVSDTYERLKGVAEVDSKNAHYRIQYSGHDKMSTPEILKGADGLIVEGIGAYGSTEDAREAVAGLQNPNRVFHPAIEIIQRAIRDQVPLFLVDMQAVSRNDIVAFDRAQTLKSIEMFLGGVLGIAAVQIHEQALEHEMDDTAQSRRSVLKKLSIATLGASSLYFSSHVPETIGELSAHAMYTKGPDENSVGRRVQKFVGGINESIHPETTSFMSEGRSNLFAQKAETVAKILAAQLKRPPVLAVELGSGHFAFEARLKDTEQQRVASLTNVLGKERTRRAATIARVDFVTLRDNVVHAEVLILQDPALARA